MNIISKFYYRSYQKVFKMVSPILPWHEPELINGDNVYDKLSTKLKENNIKKPMIISGKNTHKLGLIDPLFDSLSRNNFEYYLFNETTPDPTIKLIENARQVYIDNNCDAIIAFGGGSPMDCAKAVGARIARPNKSIPQLKGLLKVRKKLPLLVAIPTTSGTGSECTIASVVSNSDTREKYAINDLSLIPKYALLDPSLTIKLPKNTTATTGMDALTHAVEAFIGQSNTKNTEIMAKKAVKLIFENLKTAYNEPENICARSNMQLASYYAGLAFTRAYVGYVHALAHQLGGIYHTPHGLANAVLLPHVLKAYGKSVDKKLAILAREIGLKGSSDSELAKKFIDEIIRLNESMQIQNKIDGIDKKDLDIMVKRAMSEAHPLYPVPKLLDKNDLIKIYYEIM